MSRINRDKNQKSVTRKVRKDVALVATENRLSTHLEENVAVREALLAALGANEKLVILASSLATHALPNPSNKLAGLTREVASKFPARFFGLGELLEDLVPTVHQLLHQGLRPLVLIGSTDLARSYAGISALCAARASVIFLLAAGPEEGQTWQALGVNDLAILRTLPPLLIGVPSSPAELKRQLNVALQSQESVIALHYSPSLPGLPKAKPTLAPSGGIGKAQMLHEGRNLAIVALGPAVKTALALSEAMTKHGHEAAVIDASWLRPLDEPLLGAIANYFTRLVTLEMGTLTGGFGAALLEMLEGNNLYLIRVKRFSLQNYIALEPKALIERLATETERFLEKALQEEGFTSSALFPSQPSEAT